MKSSLAWVGVGLVLVGVFVGAARTAKQESRTTPRSFPNNEARTPERAALFPLPATTPTLARAFRTLGRMQGRRTRAPTQGTRAPRRRRRRRLQAMRARRRTRSSRACAANAASRRPSVSPPLMTMRARSSGASTVCVVQRSGRAFLARLGPAVTAVPRPAPPSVAGEHAAVNPRTTARQVPSSSPGRGVQREG